MRGESTSVDDDAQYSGRECKVKLQNIPEYMATFLNGLKHYVAYSIVDGAAKIMVVEHSV